MSNVNKDTLKDCEKGWVAKIRQGDEVAFEKLFFEYYYPLCSFAVKITGPGELARDAVQDVFSKVWRKHEKLEIQYSLKVYLYRAVRNQALTLVGREKNRMQLVENLKEEPFYAEESIATGYTAHSEKIIERIWELVTQMPKRRKQVFVLHRKHGLSYREISMVMAISNKTVESHMGYALQFIRDNIDPDYFG